MACSYCGRDGHNIQTCDRVRRCSCCNRGGHDRRNCPELQVPTRAGAVIGPCSIKQVGHLCRGRELLLAHLYWPASEKEKYFKENLTNYHDNGGWTFVATPKHGVHSPPRPTVNFFAADDTFASSYEEAAEERGFRHGVLIKRSEIEGIATQPEFDCADVRVGHPHSYGETDADQFWRFDIGNHRFTSVGALRFATVVRLATPARRRTVRISRDAVVAWW
jgi:hypothetical protein